MASDRCAVRGLLKTSQQMKPALGQGSKTQSVESSSSNFFKPAEQRPMSKAAILPKVCQVC